MAHDTAAARLAAWACALEIADIPPPVVRAAARHLLDGVGCAVAASRAGVVDFAVATARQFTGPAEATLLDGDFQTRLPSPAAAFANGALVHGLDFDDTHAGGLVHATAAVLPTAYAVGEQIGASGADVLAAAVAGYEIVCRIAAATPHAFHARGLHATSVCGVFASAAIASKLMGLSPHQTTDAMGIAGSAAAGSLEFLNTGDATKVLHPALAAQSGITAARLAAAGASGPASILEGGYGLYQSYVGMTVVAGAITGDLGATWETARITIKPYPNCQLLHAPLDALRTLLGKLPAAEEIAEIRFRIPAESVAIVAEPGATKVRPRSPYDAKFSLPWSAAALVVDGAVTASTYDPASVSRPEIAALASRVRWEGVERRTAAADAPGEVTVGLTSGDVLTGSVDCSTGGPASPLSDDELVSKFEANGGSRELAGALLNLADQERLPWSR